MITLKTIKSELEDIDLGIDEDDFYYLKQGENWVVLTHQSLIELGQYLVKLDLD